MKRLTSLVLMAGLLATLGGCVYPETYHRPSVVYDDGTVVGGDRYGYDYGYDYGYRYAPAYYSGYYDPWYYGYGGPWIGLGFYGSYSYGGHHHHGNYGHGSHGSHGGDHGSHGSHGGGSHHGH